MWLNPEFADTDFLMVQSKIAPEGGLRLLGQLQPKNVVVHDADDGEYYLYDVDDLLDRLQAARVSAPSIAAALALHKMSPAPILDVGSTIDVPSGRSLIAERGRIVAVHDAPISMGGADTGQDIFEGFRGLPSGAAAYTDATRGDPLRGNDLAEHVGAGPVQRSLVAEFPGEVAERSSHSLLVSLGPQTDEGLNIVLGIGSEIQVLVVPKSRFLVEGANEATLVVSGKDETLSCRFSLQALEAGPGEVRVLAFHGTQSLGALTLRPKIVAELSERASEYAVYEDALAPVIQRTPDLAIIIEEYTASSEYYLGLVAPPLNTPYLRFGPLKILTDPRAYFREFFDEIEGQPANTPQQKAQLAAKLDARGSFLFSSVFPADLQQRLWEIQDSVQSVVIQSEEPWIPWELCKLHGRKNGKVVEGPFLCERYEVTRWLPGKRWDALHLRNIAVVAPHDSKLPKADEERNFLFSLATDERNVTEIQATYEDLQAAFAEGTYDAWHFTGHGVDENEDTDRSAIILEGRNRYTPRDLAGAATNLGMPRPFVFLNACQSGRGSFSLTSMGGWANAFLGSGAAAFIGTFWSVYDTPALAFAEELYGRLLGTVGPAKKPVGRAVKEARAQIRKSGDPTWLAYTVFANPLATVA